MAIARPAHRLLQLYFLLALLKTHLRVPSLDIAAKLSTLSAFCSEVPRPRTGFRMAVNCSLNEKQRFTAFISPQSALKPSIPSASPAAHDETRFFQLSVILPVLKEP